MASMIAKTKTGIGYKGTKIVDANGEFFVELYATLVYHETKDKIILRNGGWNTPTTAQRINSALVYRGFNSGISTAGGNMSYQGKPFVNGSLALSVADLKREKIEHDAEIERDMVEWRSKLGKVA